MRRCGPVRRRLRAATLAIVLLYPAPRCAASATPAPVPAAIPQAMGPGDVGPAAASGPTAADGVRFGFFRSLFRGVNENDARAAVKAYAAAVAADLSIRTHPEPLLFENPAEATAALRNQAADLVSGITPDMLSIPAGLVSAPYLLSQVEESIGVEYLLLVRRDAGYATPAELEGRPVVVQDSVQCSLTSQWLDLLVARAGSGGAAAFFGSVKLVPKPTLAALPVFFRQVEACVITRNSFAVMAEMNPQLAQQLRPLATSPRLVPTITCFRHGYEPAIVAKVARAMSTLHETAAGRQLLTIFQSGPIAARGEEALAVTRRLLAEHAQLRASVNPGPRSAP